MIQEAGDYLKGQLPDHPNHPKGRNPYAHVALCIKNKFSNSYKDIEDEKFDEVIKYCAENPGIRSAGWLMIERPKSLRVNNLQNDCFESVCRKNEDILKLRNLIQMFIFTTL